MRKMVGGNLKDEGSGDRTKSSPNVNIWVINDYLSHHFKNEFL
jgi:hypothetical protein